MVGSKDINANGLVNQYVSPWDSQVGLSFLESTIPFWTSD